LGLLLPDQLSKPSTQVTATLPSGKSAVIKIPEDSGTAQVYDNGDPLSPGERAAIADCAAY
jgi:hypothetical protein